MSSVRGQFDSLEPEFQEYVKRVTTSKYGDRPAGWGPALRARYGYATPDDVYEAAVDAAVKPGCRWLDVGCGRDVFPNHRPLAMRLASRCSELVGVDPDATIQENPFVHRRIQAPLESVKDAGVFDVITLRMVVEHVTDPVAFLSALARLAAPRGRVVVYTVNRWSPVAIATKLIPFRWHHGIKALLWDTEEADTFPVVYKMNTRSVLSLLFARAGFREAAFAYLDDCRTFARFRALNHAELAMWRALQRFGLHYPETCLLGVFERADTDRSKA